MTSLHCLAMDGTTPTDSISLDTSHRLTWLTVDAPCLAPEALFDHLAAAPPGSADWHTGSDAVFWDDGSAVWVGLGAAVVATADGKDRWHDVRRRAGAIFRRFDDVHGGGDDGPILFGGLAFREGGASSPAWRGFGEARFFLPRRLYRLDAAGARLGVAVPSRAVASRSARAAVESRLRRLLDRLAQRLARDVPAPSGRILGLETPDSAEWRSAVDSAHTELATGRLLKVVAARPFVARFHDTPQTGAVLRALARSGGGAPAVRFAFRRRLPGLSATFVGRTPERLVAVDERRVRSEALAGTAPAGRSAGVALLASGKDLLEHRLVVEAITSGLRPLCDRLFYDTTPRLRASAGVQHLLTPIKGELRLPVHVLEAARLLHPTPAVCGSPAVEASNWIADHEDHDRGWYSGAVGHFGAAGRGEMRVALRCALLTERAGVHRARIWAGAGLVPGSDADRELEEITLKASTMLAAFDEAAREDAETTRSGHRIAVHVPFTRPA